MSKEEKVELPSIYERKWLNDDKGSAYTVLEADVQKGYNYKGRRTVDASLEIKDCNKQICLEFHYYNEEVYQQRLKKINDFINTLNKLKEFMVANPFEQGTKLTKEEIKNRNKEQFLDDDEL